MAKARVAKPFFRTRFRLRSGVEAEGAHWIGGTGTYRKADCPECKIPLVLLLDLNCEDPALMRASHRKFGELKRLPLYFCFHCYARLSYAMQGRNVRVVETQDGGPGNVPLYEGFPEYFPKTPVGLDDFVPRGLWRVVDKWSSSNDLLGTSLSGKERGLLESFFGHKIIVPRYTYHHQLGGESLREEWDTPAFECPNGECRGGLIDGLLGRNRRMKFLAGVINDPPGGLPLFEPLTEETRTRWNYFVTVYWQICDRCLTVTASASIDW